MQTAACADIYGNISEICKWSLLFQFVYCTLQSLMFENCTRDVYSPHQAVYLYCVHTIDRKFVLFDT